jgi:hypothetical protein
MGISKVHLSGVGELPEFMLYFGSVKKRRAGEENRLVDVAGNEVRPESEISSIGSAALTPSLLSRTMLPAAPLYLNMATAIRCSRIFMSDPLTFSQLSSWSYR